MKVLIAEYSRERGGIWANYLKRNGAEVDLCTDETCANHALSENTYDVIVLNLDLGPGDAMTIADYAAFKLPDAKVIFVTGSTFFADGSIFAHCPNACACLSEHTRPQDLAALVDYHVRQAA